MGPQAAGYKENHHQERSHASRTGVEAHWDEIRYGRHGHDAYQHARACSAYPVTGHAVSLDRDVPVTGRFSVQDGG